MNCSERAACLNPRKSAAIGQLYAGNRRPAIRATSCCTGVKYDTDEVPVPTNTTYAHLRDKLATIPDHVTDLQEVVIMRGKAARDVALIPASELAGVY
jgi:hypothetical protein